MKKIIIFFFIIITLFCLVNYYSITNPKIFCQKINKTYFAPKSKIRIIVHSKSYVDENSDLGNGSANVKLFQVNSANDTVFLTTSPENIDFITFKRKKIPFECYQMEKYKLFEYLISIGFQNMNKNEVNELRDAMTFINYGSKATFLEGQTKFIIVEK